MELIKVDKTRTFGAERTATFYALDREECQMIEWLEKEKELIKKGGRKDAFLEIQESVKKLAPFAASFLEFMPEKLPFLREFRLETHFGNNFQIEITSALPFKIKDRLAFAAVPAFIMSYPSLPIMECCANLRLASTTNEADANYAINASRVLGEVLEIKYAGCDGITGPRVDIGGTMTVGQASYIPRVLFEMFILARDNQEEVSELAEMRRELIRFRMNEDKSLAARALEREYKRGLCSLVLQNPSNN